MFIDQFNISECKHNIDIQLYVGIQAENRPENARCHQNNHLSLYSSQSLSSVQCLCVTSALAVKVK